MQPQSVKLGNGVLAAIAILASIALLPWLNKPMTSDEAASLYSAHLSWTALGQQSRLVDLVLLPYYSILHFWIWLSPSIQWIRMLSVLAFALTVFAGGHLGTRLGGLRAGVITALLIATNPLMTTAALLARPYALSALTATASVAALVRWFRGDGTRWMWWFCLAAVATLLFQMFSVLVPLSALGAVILLRPKKAWSQRRSVIAPIGTLLVSSVLFVAFAERQRAQVAWIPPLSGKQLIYAILGPASNQGGDYAIVILLIVAVAGILSLRAWRQVKPQPTRHEVECFAVSIAWTVLPTLILILISFIKPVFVSRYITSSVPGLAIAVGLLSSHAIGTVAWRERRPYAVGGGMVLAAFSVVILACATVAARSASQNWQAAAEYLVLHVGPSGESALPDHPVTAAINYYLNEEHRTVRTWPQTASQPLIGGLDLRSNFKAFSEAPSSVYLVDDGSTGAAQSIKVLDQGGYRRGAETSVAGVLVLRFNRSTGLLRQEK